MKVLFARLQQVALDQIYPMFDRVRSAGMKAIPPSIFPGHLTEDRKGGSGTFWALIWVLGSRVLSFIVLLVVFCCVQFVSVVSLVPNFRPSRHAIRNGYRRH
jgi:hypothetical protein